eukprot:jgi/Botrbrau1/10429/Bobra.0133s0036.1
METFVSNCECCRCSFPGKQEKCFHAEQYMTSAGCTAHLQLLKLEFELVQCLFAKPMSHSNLLAFEFPSACQDLPTCISSKVIFFVFFSKAGGGGPSRNTQTVTTKIGFVSPREEQPVVSDASSLGVSSNIQNQRKRPADADLPCQPRPSKRTEMNRKELIKEKLAGGASEEQSYREVQKRFEWLNEKNIRDAAGRRPTSKDYDPRTVAVPSDVFKHLSDSQKQYWDVKKKYRDVILFFKVGKFYELYEDDAQIGHETLGWKMTITGVGHCRQVGCPESGIDDAVARLVAAGYKVGRLEQMETAAEAKAKRGPKACIRRELTRIHTPATATGLVAADAVHLMALCEEEDMASPCGSVAGTPSHHTRFGFAFLDAAAGRYYVGTATDDAGRGNLGALLIQVAPREIIVPKGRLSSATQRSLASPVVPFHLSPVLPDDEFPSSEDAGRDILAGGKSYFGGLDIPEEVRECGGIALAALAALCVHVKRMKADSEFVSSSQLVMPHRLYSQTMRLDGATLANLDILETSEGVEGSLLARLDSCASPGGHRLLRQWLCRPLQDVEAINARLDAVDEFAASPDLVGELRRRLKGLPDVERALGQARNAASPPSLGLPEWMLDVAQRRRVGALATAAAATRQAIACLELLREESPDATPHAPLLEMLLQALPGDQDPALGVLARVEQELAEGPATCSGGPRGKKAAAAWRIRDEAVRDWLEDSEGSEPDAAAWRAAEVRAASELLAAWNSHSSTWEHLEGALSQLDVLAALAEFPTNAGGPTCRPILLPPGSPTDGVVLQLSSMWHPCARPGGNGSIVPNDLTLGGPGGPRALLLTGPNAGGKSTLLRAACVAQILAQIGCHVLLSMLECRWRTASPRG